jgi:putative superfamily III holin-X
VNTDNIVRQLRVLWRTDRIIADIRLRHLLTGLGLRAFAGLIAAFGLLMFELSAYFALVQVWGAVAAAAILGAANFAIAAILFALTLRRPSGREFDLANEIHGAPGRGTRAAIADLRAGAESPERTPADAGAAGRHHPQEPEEARGGARREEPCLTRHAAPIEPSRT